MVKNAPYVNLADNRNMSRFEIDKKLIHQNGNQLYPETMTLDPFKS